ncbi:MAG: hypothetical protein R3192_06455 [Woeseiaceae bacterium]|nr:hypothetical protein [Woeseiaceae bacterium]
MSYAITPFNLLRALTVLLFGAVLTSCASYPPPCTSPQTRNLDHAIDEVKSNLSGGTCAAHFERFYDDLLTIAEGDPKPENKRLFSEFLVWASDEGLLSQRQARDYYNRYFNVKFTSMQGDYNNCSHTCPRRDRIMLNMQRELSDKERGLLKVSLDNNGYYRADELYQEIELVLEATCTACAAAR